MQRELARRSSIGAPSCARCHSVKRDFTPFSITDAEGSHLITQGNSSIFTTGGTSSLCLDFGTADSVIGPGCNAGGSTPNEVYFAFNFYPFPISDMDQPGVYTITSDQYFVLGGEEDGNDVYARGDITLTVTETPEPSTTPVIAVALGYLLFDQRRRRALNQSRQAQ
jgi:hypothetical protein